MGAIALDRYCSVMHPLKYRVMAAEANMTKVLPLVWAFGVVPILPSAVGCIYNLPRLVHHCGVPSVNTKLIYIT